MPTIEPADGSRFMRVSDPDFEPLYFDPAAVAAIVGHADGHWTLHLAGGQKIQLPPPIAAAVLKQLGLPVPKAKAKARRSPRVKQPARPASHPVVARLAAFFGA